MNFSCDSGYHEMHLTNAHLKVSVWCISPFFRSGLKTSWCLDSLQAWQHSSICLVYPKNSQQGVSFALRITKCSKETIDFSYQFFVEKVKEKSLWLFRQEGELQMGWYIIPVCQELGRDKELEGELLGQAGSIRGSCASVLSYVQLFFFQQTLGTITAVPIKVPQVSSLQRLAGQGPAVLPQVQNTVPKRGLCYFLCIVLCSWLVPRLV